MTYASKIQSNNHRWLAPLAIVLTLVAGLVGCDNDYAEESGGSVATSEQALVPFEDCASLEAYTEAVILEQLVRSRYTNIYFAEASGGDGSQGAPASNDSGSRGPSDYTTTNVQEEGVDEADYVKTDGEYIYLAQGSALTIIRSWPALDTAKIAEIDIEGYAQSMFLRGDKVLVMSNVYNDGSDPIFGENNNFYGGTRLTLVDVSDRENPTIERELDFQGWMNSGRMIGGDAHLVLNAYVDVPYQLWDLVWQDDVRLPEFNYDDSEAEQERTRAIAREQLRPRVRQFLAGTDVQEWLPKMRDEQGVRPMYTCDELYRPAEVSQLSVLSLVSLDLDEPGSPATNTGLLADGWTVYASQDNLYVAQSSWWWWWGWGALDLTTNIHKFNLRGSEGRPVYVASGEVNGWLLNQFSMSEHEGVLRVATTDNDWWWGAGPQDEAGGNNVYTLRNIDGRLEQIGALTGLAPGEQIYAARMMGDKGYIVTFRQVDPLFTIDLSDATAPRLVGELKIPGYSAYLHPMDDGHLLAVGMDGTDEGQLTGMAISIFDVSDFANPRLAHKMPLNDSNNGWSWSEALHNHHAFTYHRGKLSIPAHFEEYTNGRYSWFSGLVVFDIDAEAGIQERGKVNHSDLVVDPMDCPEEHRGTEECQDYYRPSAQPEMRRSIYIEDYVYSISTAGVKVSPLNDPSASIADVMLAPPY